MMNRREARYASVDMAAEGQDWDDTDWVSDSNNLNADLIATGIPNASNMWLNPLTGTVQFSNPTTSDKLVLGHGEICQELTETYKKKNADYGNSFGNSLDKHGLIAGIVRMDDKMSRLISLNSKKEQ